MADPIIPEYRDRINHDLLRLIPPDARVVLEIGCGTGRLCEAFKRINPAIQWSGIEIDRTAAETARTILADVWCGDVANFTDNCVELLYAPDVLICGDVLEHLIDPWDVLKRLVSCLAPNAQILASIPNIQHWTIQEAIRKGEFSYSDPGVTTIESLFDRGHLRWFTRKTMRAMFEDAGLHVFEMIPCIWGSPPPPEWHSQPDALASQFIVRAIKPHCATLEAGYSWIHGIEVDPSKAHKFTWPAGIKSLYIHAVHDTTVCARQRIEEPLRFLNTIPGVRTTLSTMNAKASIDAGVDTILIFQRSCSTQFPHDPEVFKARIAKLAERCPRCVIVYEIDDDPRAILPDPSVMAHCHVVQCSTEPLAEVCRQWNPNVMVFPNQIADLPRLKSPAIDPDVDIIYAAQNRQSDWEPIMPALNSVLASHPNVYFEVIADREFFDALEMPDGRKTFYPFLQYPEYRKRLEFADIALLPLEDTPFNRCKSDLKFLECAAEGVAVIAKGKPYEATWCVYPEGPLHGIWKNVDGFEEVLKTMISKPDLRQSAINRSYAYIRDHRLLSQHYRAYHNWYLTLLAQRSTLDQDRCDRVDRLGLGPLAPDPQSNPA